MSCRVKICGVTCVEDAQLVLHSGADAIGVNLIPSSKRYVGLLEARAILDIVRGKLMTVLVIADPPSVDWARQTQQQLGADYLQLHGNEPPELLQQLGANAYKAVRVGSPDDAAEAERYPGDLLLADAKVPGELGGSGVSFDWALVDQLARKRKLILAGGLTADNVATAVRRLNPWGVDVASGVEEPTNARRKSPQRVLAFLTAVRGEAIER